MSDKEYYPLEVIDDILSGSKDDSPTSTLIKIEDASSETSRILVPEMGSDEEYKVEGKVDWRRFGHTKPIDPFWMAHFLLVPKYQGGDYSSKLVNHIGNLNYSIGGEHKKLSVDMQKAVSGKGELSQQPKKKRSMIDRILGRNKEYEE